MLELHAVELPVDIEQCERASAAGMIVIRHAAWINKGDTMKLIVKGMMSSAEDDAIDLLTEELFRLLSIVGIVGHGTYIVRDPNFIAVEVFDPRVRETGQIEVK